jgi:hypothetical protein
MTTLTIAVNNTSTDQAYPTGTWVTVVPGTDYLIFTNGSSAVANGQPIPSSFQLGSAGVVLNGLTQVVPVYLLASVGANLLKQIYLMGSANKRYVMAFNFSGATTSEPVLQAWDDTSLSTTNNNSLGAGTPANSWLHGITTTTGLPGSSWVGSPLAGSGSGNYLNLNNGSGPLSGAATLYCQLQMIIPSTQTLGGAETPVLVVKYTTT